MSENVNEVRGQLLQLIKEEGFSTGTVVREPHVAPSICRVPNELLEGNEKCYKPGTVSIGPFHAHDISLSSADERKRAYLKGFISSFPQGTTLEQLIQEVIKSEERSVGDSTDEQELKAFLKGFISRFPQGTTVEHLIQEMMKSEAIARQSYSHKGTSTSSADKLKKLFLRNFISRFSSGPPIEEFIIDKLMGLEESARDCYEGQISLSSYEFLKIMLLDGCFIVELLLKDWKNINRYDLVMARGRLPLYSLQQDLLKLENQIPFFILKYLYDLVQTETNGSISKNQSLVESALSFFELTMPEGHKLCPPNPDQAIKHLLHLVKMALFPPTTATVVDMPRTTSSSILSKKRGASELESAYGVKFKKLENAFLLQIEFRNGVLEIPQLVFEESTSPLFLNLLVSELRSEEYGKGLFTSYVIFMDSLISNQKDVEVLLRSGIFQTRTNDVSGLVSFFNGLSINLITNREHFHFSQLLHNMNAYCESGLRPQRAYLMNNYYEARWDVLNSFLLFFLTLTQTLFSVLSYSPPNKQR